MYNARQHFFAGAGFTVDDNAVIGAGNGFHLMKYQGHGFIFGDDIRKCRRVLQIGKYFLAAKLRQIMLNVHLFKRAVDKRDQFITVQRLDQIV